MTEHGAKWDISAVEIEAAAWIAQIDGGRFSHADKAALREWCARSEAHREALRRQGAIWSELDSLAALPAQLAAQGRESAGRSHLRWRPFWVAHAALAVLIVAVLVTWIGVPGVDRVGPSVQIYATRVGELKTIVLNDQSTVRLNTNSLVEVDYRPNERRIRLVKGEALFDVAKDPRRRFVVHASENTVRAVGTRFSVRLLRDRFEVVVSEGVVELTRTIPGSGQPVQSAVSRLEPRQAAYLDAESAAAVSIETLDVGEIARHLSWTSGVLEFDGEPLKDVIAEVSRYTSLQIEVKDPSLRELPVAGRFRVGDTQALFDVIEAGFGASIVREGNVVTITGNAG
jgi:transmembrane sensor